MAVEAALNKGNRNLPGDSSLAQLLAEHRRVRNKARLPKLTRKQILTWADGHRQRTGQGPTKESGAVLDAPGETWLAIQPALVAGLRRLPGGSSLARLLAERRGVRNRSCLPDLTPKQIRTWALAHRRRTGKWPPALSGPVVEAPGETWKGVEMALVQGHRGMRKGSSLARVLKPLKGMPS
jgi:hypothetical protein